MEAFKVIQDAMFLKAKLGYLPSGWDINKPDQSIFMGQLGIGYCLLRLLKPESPYDPLLPAITKPPEYVIKDTPAISAIKRKIVKRYFPNTLALCSDLPLFDDVDEPLRSAIQKISGHIGTSEEIQNETKNQFFIENEKLKLELEKPSFEFLWRAYQQVMDMPVSMNYSDSILSLNDYVKIIAKDSENPRLIVKRRYGVEEYALEPFGHILLTTIEQCENRTFQDLLNYFHNSVLDQFSFTQCEKFLALQIEEYLKGGIIKADGNTSAC